MTGIWVLRKMGKVSRNQLAEQAEIGRFRLWQFETGRADPTADEELALRAALLQLVRERATKFHELLQSGP